MKTMEFVFFILLHASCALAYINRMECSYDANFTIMDTNKYYDGTISKTVYNVNKTECVTYCFTHDACAFVNFKLDETECQLMTEDQSGTYGESIGWEFLSTDYRTIRVGAICRHRDPCDYRYCYDDCESDEQYVCDGDQFTVNVAQGKTVESDSGETQPLPTDGYLNTNFYQNVKWLRTDLRGTYIVDYSSLSIFPQNEFSVSIGNNADDPEENEFCTRVKPLGDNVITFCENDIPGQVMKLEGQYFFIYYDVALIDISINVKEILIYVKK